MGVIKIEGKSVTLDDQIIDAGIPAIKAALSVDFPDVENADIEIIGSRAPGVIRSATVVKRGTGKGLAEMPDPRCQISASYCPLIGDTLEIRGFSFRVFAVDARDGQHVCAGSSGARRIYSLKDLVEKDAVIVSRGSLARHIELMDGQR